MPDNRHEGAKGPKRNIYKRVLYLSYRVINLLTLLPLHL